MRVCRFVLFFLAALFFASCSRIDEVDINSFDQPDGGALNGTIAVFGSVTTEMRQHRVTISPVHQWGDNRNAMPEINRVFVLCGNDTIPYIEKDADRNKMILFRSNPSKARWARLTNSSSRLLRATSLPRTISRLWATRITSQSSRTIQK